jgi:hypothetical protein
MKHNDFKVIYDRLNEPADITKLSQELGLDVELLDVIFTQRTVRETTKSFYKVQRNAQKLVSDWNHGLTLLEVARKWNFPPILTGLMIYQVSGRSKKQFWNLVRNADTITDESLRNQILEISEEDLVYSPQANERQYKRGTWGEEKLQCWLDGQNISYRTEKDLRGEFPKTPDCLLDKPIKVNGWEVNWIESKATFGDRVEVNKNMKKQLEPYLELFGQGVVIYWFGFVDEITPPEGIYISDASITSLICKMP